jgi:beta-glucosidase
VQVRSAGDRPGVEVAQSYIAQRGTSVARPVRELKGCHRVMLRPGESRQLELTLSKDELAFWNYDMKNVAELAALTVWVAPDARPGHRIHDYGLNGKAHCIRPA